jgi:hypothetical protein
MIKAVLDATHMTVDHMVDGARICHQQELHVAVLAAALIVKNHMLGAVEAKRVAAASAMVTLIDQKDKGRVAPGALVRLGPLRLREGDPAHLHGVWILAHAGPGEINFESQAKNF